MRTRVEIEEQERQQTNYPTGLSQTSDRQPLYSKTQAEEEETTESAITPAVRQHLSKVYGLLMAGCATSAAGAVIGGVVGPVVVIPALILGIAAIIGLWYTNPERVTLRQNLFLGTTALLGALISPLLFASSPGVILAATVGTASIFGGFTLAALRAKRRAMLALQGFLFGGLILTFAAGISTLILPLLGVTSPAILGALYNVNLYLGLVVFSVFIAYDTQRMIESFHEGDQDHVLPALNMFTNIFGVFVRLLRIFGGGSD